MTQTIDIKRILIPIDFSDTARLAFNEGLKMAAQHGADAFVLHVAEPIHAFDFVKQKYIETQEAIERVQEGVDRRIEELWQSGGLEAVDRRKVHMIVRGGRAHEEILATAEARETDLIIMGSSGASDKATAGSTSERVLRSAKCAVYFVRNPGY